LQKVTSIFPVHLIEASMLRLLALLLLLIGPATSTLAAQDAPRKGVGMIIEGDGETFEVSDVISGSPAEKAGIKPGDKLVSIAGISIFDIQPETMRAIADTAKTIAIIVMRGEQKMTFNVTPAVMNLPTGTPTPQVAPR
jgi:predicted metalloprotease with PDZ domain